MTTEYIQLIGLTLIGGLLSLIGGVILLRSKKTANNLATYATPFAAGALLAAVFLDLLRDGFEEGSVDTLLYATLIGIVTFFLAERLLHWFHHHHDHDGQDVKKSLIVVGDTMHNALDGVAIASAFLVSPATGLVTAVAVAAHEIPQEIGDFGLLLSKGMRPKRVLIVNIMSAFATTLAAVIAYALGSASALPVDVLIGLSAGFLLYIAMSDIIPGIHESASKKNALDVQSLLLVAGLLVVGTMINISHQYIHASHDSDIEQCEQLQESWATRGPLEELSSEDARCIELLNEEGRHDHSHADEEHEDELHHD